MGTSGTLFHTIKAISLRLCLGLTAIACPLLAFQGVVVKRTQLGAFEVLYAGDDLVIRKGDQEWHIRMQDLPVRRGDCEQQVRCADSSLGGCYGLCIWGVDTLTIDEASGTAYFAVATGIAQNKPWIIFGYGLKTQRTFRLTNEWGGGFGPAIVSPEGRYLAYVFYPHTPVVCPTKSWLGVVDTQERRSAIAATAQSAADASNVTALHWGPRLNIDYEEEILPADQCNDAESRLKVRRVSGTIDVQQLSFK